MATIPTDDIILAALVFTTVLIIMVYTIIRMRRQRDRLKRDIDSAADLLPDRAYNQLALATSEALILERDAVDTHHPREMLAEAQKQIDRHNFSSALKTAQSAHDQLVLLRRDRSAGSSSGPSSANPSRPMSPLRSSNAIDPVATGSGPAGEDAANPPVPSSRPTPNRAESHFQMNCLASELADRRTRKPDDPRIAAGEKFLSEAQTAYRKQDYTEALRAGLKGRRAIGTQLETLAPSTTAGAGTGSSAAESSGSGSITCPKCGRSNRSVDQFCRGCGTSLKVEVCPRCHQPLETGDVFCGSCGFPIGS